MAISTQTQALIDFYEQKNVLDTNQISQVNIVKTGYTIDRKDGSTPIKIYGPDELISNFAPAINAIDQEIITINNQIKNLQQVVLGIGTIANSVGCGSTEWSVGFTTVTVLQDNLNYKGYSYNSPNPFSQTTGNLNTSSIGIGTHDFISQVSIGTYYDPVGTCNNIMLCTSELCTGYATSISNLNSSISTLQAERNGLMTKVNYLKGQRISFELQKYAYDQSIQKINEQITISNLIIDFLKDPANDEFL
jgi:hypothetical protein